MKGTVLLVEDELSVGNLIRRYLQLEGYSVVWAETGEEALVEAQRHPIDAVLIDINLPGMDGFDVCREVRARSNVPVIMLTARDQEADRVAGFEVGADDYVTKPFSPRELMARLKAVLRRSSTSASIDAVLAVGGVRLDQSSREARINGELLELTAKEFDLLAFLLRHAGAVATREMLLDRVWGLEFPGGTRTVDVHIGQLRRKLGRPELIETVRGIGYKLSRSGDTEQ